VASMIVWSGGLAGSGIDAATLSPVIVSSSVIWLDNVNGNDANAGTAPENPKKTLSSAITAASATGTIIAVASGSNETIVGTVTINKAVKIVAFGSGSTAGGFTQSASSANMLSVTTDDVSFEGVYFRSAASGSSSNPKVTTGNKGLEFLSCTWDLGTTDGAGIVFTVGADYFRVQDCAFNRIGAFAGGAGTTPKAINISGAAIAGKIINTSFNGGSFGWQDGAAIDLTGAPVRLYMKNVTLSGKSDVSGTSPSYVIIGVTTSGASLVSIT
jgi:hypothetical protein